MSGFFQNDCRSIISNLKDQEKQIRLKRRWLLGCDVSESENHKFVPESLLREDDIFYETIQSRVEEAFGIRGNEDVVQRKESKFCSIDVIRQLDSLTNKGLYLIAMIVTGGSTLFEKTRWRMKEVIKESIERDFKKKEGDIGKADIAKQMYQVLSDRRNFREDCVMDFNTCGFQSNRDAVLKILSELDNLSTQTLLAMKRKLKGSRTVPRLKTSKCGLSRSVLIDQVRRASETMLSGEKLPKQLAKAMSLVDLSLRLSPGYKTTTATEFVQFSPETKELQNEILKALWLLHKKIRFRELKRLQLLLDPEAEVSNDSLRSAVRKMLTEYLFECSDMEAIPESLVKALSLVNRSTRNVEHKVFPREAIEEETGCILNVSAQVKNIFLECISDYELDQDFDDAYMEELEDSDDDDVDKNRSLFDNEKFVNRCRNIKLEVKGTEDDEMDSYESDHEESGAECSVLDVADSTYATNEHYLSSLVKSVVIRDLSESITRVNPRSLYVTPTSNKSTLISERHDEGLSKTRVKVERDSIEMEVDNQFSSRSLFSVENIKTTDDHGERKPRKRDKNQYLSVQEISDETSMVAHNLIGRLLEKFADQKGLELDADERSYLGGDSTLQDNMEVSEEKQASSQVESDESTIVSVVKELMPSIGNSVLMKLQELINL